MASHRHHQPHLHPLTTCCINSSYGCCSPLSPPPSTDQLLQVIASLLPQSDPIPTYSQTHTHKLLRQNQYHRFHPRHSLHKQENQTHPAIASLLCRIEALESSLHHFSSHDSLRDTAARIIQTHFRAFLVRRSRTLGQLKDLALIKSTFNSLKSSFSNETHIVDFVALFHKATDLLLQLDSIQGGDPMIRDGKRSISRDLVQFLESIEGIVVKKHGYFVKTTKNPRFAQTQSIKKSRVSDSKKGNLDDDQRKLLKNLRDRVEEICQFCELSANNEDVGNDGGDHNVLINRRNGASLNKNGVSVQRYVVQPKVKKSVSFADDVNVSKVYSDTYEPLLSGDVSYMDGSSSSEEQGELLENHNREVEHSSRDVEDDDEEEEEVVLENGGSPESSDGERNSRRDIKNDGRNEIKGNQKVVFSAPLPLRMEPRTDLMKSKGVRIGT
ncbi:hypothetical protein L6164_006745 [Bauhinia variegata]|uniref:Uncharacterized protein n=1 Tax=Bauhinia variegata TaxID=167791 RepID=A0ACB9PUL2_BAUVA|nr:hypothetical protein L6164_006745 [Bauhinia variegata]